MISNGDVERSHEASGPEQRFRGLQAAPGDRMEEIYTSVTIPHKHQTTIQAPEN